MHLGKTIPCSFVLFLFFAPLLQSAKLSGENRHKIDKFMRKIVKCRHIAGLTLAVVNEDGTFAAGYGVADVESGRKVDKQTLFNIGSISKMFTAAILVDLMENNVTTLEGKALTWDTKLTDVLGPDYILNKGQGGLSLTTLKDVVSHRTGLMTADLAVYAGFPDNFTRDEFSKRLKLLRSDYAFRDRFLYNNVLNTLAGHVTEKLTGQTWEQLLQEKLFQPLGMTSSTWLNRAFFLKNNTALPHFHNSTSDRLQVQDNSIYRLNPMQPIGAICSNAEDMTKWLTLLLQVYNWQRGNPRRKHFLEMFDEQIVLNSERRDFREVRPPVFPVDDIQVAYCLGFMTRYFHGMKVYFHTGSFNAYSSMLWLVPGINSGFFVSINGPGQNFKTITTIMYYLSELFRGYGSWINATTACTFPIPWAALDLREKPAEETRGYAETTKKSAKTYTGTYGNGVIGNLLVEEAKDGNGLYAKLGIQLRGRLRPLKDNLSDMLHMDIEGPLSTTDMLEKGILLEFDNENAEGKYSYVFIQWNKEVHAFVRNALFEDAFVSVNVGCRGHIDLTLSYLFIIVISLLHCNTDNRAFYLF